jgi:primary-amine oxidase
MTVDHAPYAETESPATTGHPLDPLAAEEISATTDIVRRAGLLTPSLRFVTITLREPDKPAGLDFSAVPTPDRQADVVAWDGAARMITEGVVSLTGQRVVSWVEVPGRFPPFLGPETADVEAVVRADPRWQEAMRKRGVEAFDLTMIDPWPAGYYGPQDDHANSPRVSRALTFVRSAPGEHGYARPIEGLIVTVDLDGCRILEVEDHGVVPVPPQAGNYAPQFAFDPGNRPAFTEFRTGLRPIEITQPEGASFTVEGWGVTWQKWSLRVGFTPREGLVLHTVAYDDRGRVRPVMYRASLSEMVVPYGDPAPTHWNKNVFDMGECGMGRLANPLTLGCDCLGEIFYFDGVVNDEHGHPVVIDNAICMHEEDYGISWKHTDYRTGDVEVRRSRRLVISSIATVGNYEYGFFWYLYTDGSIEYEIKLTGVLTTGAVAVGEQPRHGALVAPGLYGPNHQHLFSVRLDMSVDGPGNTVYAVDSVPEPEPERNPHHNAWIARPTAIETEGPSDFDLSTARYWKVANPSQRNELGQEVAYKLAPREVVPSMVQEGSAISQRAGFVHHNLWVTRYDRDEMYAAGDYPAQCAEVQGLPVYVADAAPVVDDDVVLWYTVGAHHVVRPEDWPVMPVAYAGFHLKPLGFFDGNPALDVPPTAAAHCHHEG